MDKTKKVILINSLYFIIGIIATYQGAINSKSWIGPLVVGAILLKHLLINNREWKKELSLILSILLITYCAESILIYLNIYQLAEHTRFIIPIPFAPLWIVALWVNYAMRVKEYLPMMRKKLTMQFFTGLIFGFLIFRSLFRLNLVILPMGFLSSFIVAFTWGVLMIFIYWLADKILSQKNK